jgi:hypothetical protein
MPRAKNPPKLVPVISTQRLFLAGADIAPTTPEESDQPGTNHLKNKAKVALVADRDSQLAVVTVIEVHRNYGWRHLEPYLTILEEAGFRVSEISSFTQQSAVEAHSPRAKRIRNKTR